MYFIARNNKTYQYIAHVKPLRRYVFTGAVLCSMILGFYFLERIIDTYGLMYFHEHNALQKKYNDRKQVNKKNNKLSEYINQMKNKAIVNDEEKNADEFFKTQLLF